MESLEDQALAVFNHHQAMVTIKGVEDNFNRLTHIVDILEDGDTLRENNADKYILHAADMNYGIIGMRIAEQLGMGYSFPGTMQVYAPRREGQLNMADPSQGFTMDELYSPGALFCVRQAKYDAKYIITSLDFARQLFEQEGHLSSLELRLRQKGGIYHIVGSCLDGHQNFTLQSDSIFGRTAADLVQRVLSACFLKTAKQNIIPCIKKQDLILFVGSTKFIQRLEMKIGIIAQMRLPIFIIMK